MKSGTRKKRFRVRIPPVLSHTTKEYSLGYFYTREDALSAIEQYTMRQSLSNAA
jgi:hypothetical protein